MKNFLNLTFAILVFVVLGCSCPNFGDLGKKRSVPSPAETPAPFSTPANTVTIATEKGDSELSMSQYNQISIGTSRGDVERILGGKGTEISNTVGGGVRFSVNKWEGEKFKSIILSFKNDKVMTRSQVGLK